MGRKVLTALLLSMAVMATATGCSEYYADIPEFTTAGDRDTGFIPSEDSGGSSAGSSSGRDNTDIEEKQDAVGDLFEEYQAEANTFSQEFSDALNSIGN